MNSSKSSKLNYVNLLIRIIYISIILTVLFVLLRLQENGNGGVVKGSTTINTGDIQNVTLPIIKSNRKPADIRARNFALYDVESGSMLYGQNYDNPVPIASLTKIMTALIITSENTVSDQITVPKEATLTIGSLIDLMPNEKISVESLLTGMLINSGNDASLALAYYNIANNNPGIEFNEAIRRFVEKMNQYAKTYNLQNTRYLDPAGLDDNALSTARDQGLILTAALNNDLIKKIIHTASTEIFSVDGQIKHSLESSNRLVKDEMYYPGIIGGKTGFTPLAGHNLVTAANINNHTLVAVILSTYDTSKTASAVEARKLLDWGYNNFDWIKYSELTNLYLDNSNHL